VKDGPRIVFVANLWTLAGHPTPKREWSLARKVAAISAEGFSAVTAPASLELASLIKRYSLRYTGFFSSSRPRDFPRLIRAQRRAGAENINVQLGDDFTPPSKALAWTLALQREARRQEIYTALEVHRDTLTETPEKLYALARGYRRATGETLPITWDHSHPAVVKHLKPPLFSKVLLQKRGLIQSARLLHCRPFNGQHAQIPVFSNGGRLTVEFRTWLTFVEDLFRCWLAGPRPNRELWVCPEIGPVGIHGYNLSTMPPSWPQAIICKRELAKLWRKLGGVLS
jgi:hypothetical protein